MEIKNPSQHHQNNGNLTVSEFLAKSLDDNALEIEAVINAYFAKKSYLPTAPENIVVTTNVLLFEILKELKSLKISLNPQPTIAPKKLEKNKKNDVAEKQVVSVAYIEDTAEDYFHKTSILVRSCFTKAVEPKRAIVERIARLPDFKFDYEQLKAMGILKNVRAHECQFIGDGKNVLVSDPIIEDEKK